LSANIAEAFDVYAFYPSFGERKKYWTTGPHAFAVHGFLHQNASSGSCAADPKFRRRRLSAGRLRAG
jgi:hypothetical protein